MKKVFFAILLALVAPAVAHAGRVTMVARDVPLGPRGLQSASAPMPFNMLGLHWQGGGSVAYRTRSAAGIWSGWKDADDDSGPDLRSPERRPGWRDGALDWVGASQGVKFRTSGSVTRVRAFYLWSKVTARAGRTLSVAGSPTILPRTSWFADEKIKRGKPLYAAALRLAIVHHTAGTNSYTREQAAAIVRGIELYHVKANGWNDIGYNLLVDRFGTVYEGRAGGLERNVIGAHSLGFNTGSVGVAMIGNFTAVKPPPAMESALARVLAWRLDLAHVDPLSRVVASSGGNAKFKAGKVVTLRAISGHLDTGPTACPGNAGYAMLPALARSVSMIGLPKLYSPVVSGALGGSIRFQGRLSAAVPWKVTVTDTSGRLVAQGKGASSTIDWTWSSTGLGKGPFLWTIDGGSSVLPASGTLGAAKVAPAPAVAVPSTIAPTPAPALVEPLTGLSAIPSVVTPSPDGTGGNLTADFALGADAAVTARLTSTIALGPAPRTLLSASLPAGEHSFNWNLAVVPDGRYLLTVTAKPAGRAAASQSAPVVVDRSLSGFGITPSLFSPNGDGVADTLSFGFNLTLSLPVQIQLRGAVGATIYTGQLGPGPQAVVWDGSANGTRVPDGAYEAIVSVTDALGVTSFQLPLTIDTTPPLLGLLDPAGLRFQLSEPGTVTIVVNGQTVVVPEPAGPFTIALPNGPVATLSASAADAAGNVGATITYP